ncbi:CAMSAP1 [Branchiostoma lanceolatum]|uniref:CAMSAP1 protein n=1 Tax=Branchiostoma lanceolatum TaxID=7740 RepID=A0A8J9Z475_BRALA|nr:CAMSAP1 [Branchiostoma lanceolatum]
MSGELPTRQPDQDDGPAVPDIVPLTEYDTFRTKVHASMLWAIGKAYGGLVPPELQWPFFTDDEGTEQLTPLLVGMLTAGELYCMICTQLFREPCDWGGHWSGVEQLTPLLVGMLTAGELYCMICCWSRAADAVVGGHADGRRAGVEQLTPLLGPEQLTPLLVGMLTAGELYCMICCWSRAADAVVGGHADGRRAGVEQLTPLLGTEQLTPLLVGMLTAGELYCMICTQLFREPCDWGGHWSVMQALSRRGIQAMEDEENGVSQENLQEAQPINLAMEDEENGVSQENLQEAQPINLAMEDEENGVSQENLQEAQPINLKSHLAVLDALMEAYINEVISIEGVVTAVKKFATFNASQELPYDMEDALLFWLNKVGRTLQDRRGSKKVNAPEGGDPCGWDLPTLDDILKDLSDGRVLLAVLCFYCPNHIRPEDGQLGSLISMSESVRNLSLVRRFCDQHLGAMFHLSYEDVLYSPEVLKPNIKAFIAELFWWLEVVRPDIVQPALTNHQQTIPFDAEVSSTPTRARPRPNVPISRATKRSFQTPDHDKPSNRDTPSNLSITPSHSSPDISRHTPLLALRHRAKQNSQQGEGEEVLHPLRRSNSLNSASDAAVQGSVMAWPEVANSNGGVPRPGNVGHESQQDMDLESVSSRPESRSDRGDSSLASQDAQAPREAVRDSSLASQDAQALREAARDGSPATQAPREPLMPAVLRPSKEKTNACKKEDELGEGPDKSVTKIDRTGRLRHTVVSSDVDTMDQITPISESVSSFSLSSSSDVVMGSQGDSDSTISSESCSANRPLGFYLAPVSSAMSYDTTDHPEARAIPTTGKSYTVAENMYTTESAQAAGIPIIDDNVGRAAAVEEETPGTTEDGDVVESPKLHSETLDKESLQKESIQRESLQKESFQRESLQMEFLQRDPVQIQTWGKSDKNCNGGVPTATTPQEVKVATSGHVTTWGRNRASRGSTPEEQENGHGAQPLASQMVKLRLKLEEKRRTIENEKKKMELQWNRQRQRVGKAAFLHVISQKKATPTKEPAPENYHYDRGDNNGRIRFDKNEVPAPCMTGFASAKSSIPEEVATEVNQEPVFSPKQSHDLPMSPNEVTSPGDVIDLNEYNTSLERLNSDLSLIQKEIARLSHHQDVLKSQSSPPAKERVPSSPKVKPVSSKSSPKSKEKNVAASTPKMTHANVAGTVSTASSVSSNQSRSSKKQLSRVTAMEASPTIEHVQHRRLAASQSDQTLGLGSSGPQFDADLPRSESEQGPTTSRVDHENGAVNVQTTFDSSVEQWALTGEVCKPEDSREEAGLPESPGAEGKAAAVGFFSFNSVDADKTKEEVTRKREQFLRARMKREEQLKVRQMEREAEQEREREERKRRQEEAEQRKAEEKIRKELIYQEYQRRKHEQELQQQQQRKGARPKKSRPKSGPPTDSHKGSSSSEYERRKHKQELQQQQQRKGARPKKSRPKSGPPADSHKGSSSSGGSRPASVVESRDETSGSSGSGRKTPDWEQSSQSSTSEYTGPKLFVKPSTKSNRHIIINALKDCCLAGEVNNQVKGKVLEALAMSGSNHYVILFRDARCQFRAVYSYNPENEKIHKLVGNGPSNILGKMINSLYKYNSGGKQFVGIPSKTMSVSVDALTIHSHLWQSKKSGK